MTKEEAISCAKRRACVTISKWTNDTLSEGVESIPRFLFDHEFVNAVTALNDDAIYESLTYCYNNIVAIRKRISELQKQGF